MTSAVEPKIASSNKKNKIKMHEAFELIKTEKINALNITLQHFSHKKTGALHYHLVSESSENVFLVALRTVPTDSTGVAHILEHTALCGSKKYPVRDPFFMMIRRSLNTFMNAFTSSDWTAYPFASQNKKDFNNLLDVYLDAVFFTRLDELDFLQEGHRIEFKESNNTGSELVYKGVVFNEMKGAMSSPISVLWQELSKYLYPNNTYHYNSGGEPDDIPDLTYQQLKDFHKTHYHPSNAVFMTFGDIPAYQHQEKFESQVLSSFNYLNKTITVKAEKRYLAPVNVEQAYAFDAAQDEDTSNKTHHVLSWLLGPCTSLDEMIKANLLSQVLLSNSASPLRKALETSELGASPSPLCGLEDSNYEMCFVCGLEGSEISQANDFETLVLDVLNEVAENGIAYEQLKAVLHQLELSQREIGGGGYPFGLQLILNGLTAAIHRGDPASLLNLDPIIKSLHEEIKAPEFIKNLVKDLLINNQHRVRLTLHPDTKLSARKQQAEQNRLKKIKQQLTEPQKQAIVSQTKALEKRQLEEDNPEILPKVTLDDVPDEIKFPRVKSVLINSTQAAIYPQGTNGLSYHEIVCELPQLTTEELAILPYFSACLTELGCDDKDYLQVQQWQANVCGDISASHSIRCDTDDAQKIKAYYVFSGKALNRNNKKLAELMCATLNKVKFDEKDRVVEIIKQIRTSKERSVTGNGHVLAMTAAASGFNPVAALNHQYAGLAGIQTIKKLDDSHLEKQNISATITLFKQIHRKIKNASKRYMLTAEEENTELFLQQIDRSWQVKKQPAQEPFSLLTLNNKTQQMWIANTQVNFCAKAYPTVTLAHNDAAALTVLGGFLRNGYLHTAIREQGGAYGGGAMHDINSGAFKFYSYRDPRMSETLTDFDKAIDWMLQTKHHDRQLEEAILGVISSIDKPSSPAGEAKADYHNKLHGRNTQILKKFRQQVLALKIEDLKRVTEKYLKKVKASTVVITNTASYEKTGDLGMDVVHL